jgi:hypothetical protein
MLTALLVLVLVGLGLLVAHAVGKLALWPAVLVLYVAELLRALPLGR